MVLKILWYVWFVSSFLEGLEQPSTGKIKRFSPYQFKFCFVNFLMESWTKIPETKAYQSAFYSTLRILNWVRQPSELQECVIRISDIRQSCYLWFYAQLKDCVLLIFGGSNQRKMTLKPNIGIETTAYLHFWSAEECFSTFSNFLNFRLLCRKPALRKLQS